MSNTTYRHARIFWVLLSKDIKLLTARLDALFLDCIAPLVTQVLTFGYLFPLLGMPNSMIAPVYLGSMMTLLIQLGFTFLIRVAFDIKDTHFIDYQNTLPISKKWLFSSYIVSNMIETAIAAIPLITAGLLVLHNYVSFEHTSVIALLAVIIMNLLFFATFFLACAIYYDFNWLINNMWPRRIIPLLSLSASLVIWSKAYAWSPTLGIIMLFSPFTYAVEGMRSSILGSQEYLSPLTCLGSLALFISINIIVLTKGIRKKLDPV